ncbi:MAG: LVIVD repeat-containing protein [Actinomycetota bacterium]
MKRVVLGLVSVALMAGPVAASATDPVRTLILEAPSGLAEADSGGFSSENVEWVSVFPQHTGSSGGKMVGKYYYMTDPRGVYIYDIKDPAAPVLVGELPAVQIGTGLALAQEEPDTNGDILLVNAYNPSGPGGPTGTNALQVVDVTDKTAPTVVGALSISDHTWTCILDCKYAIGRTGHILDLSDPSKPERIGDWRESVPFAGYVHDFEEVSPGRVIASGQPSLYMSFSNPTKPEVRAVIETEFHSLGYHGADWANGGKDKLLVMGAEVAPAGGTNLAGSDCTDEGIHAVATYDATAVLKADRSKRYKGETFRKLQEWRVAGRGAYADGNAPAHTLYCGHWFDTHPKWKAGGTLALAHYDWGTRFLDVASNGAIEQVGYFQPVRGYTASAKWINDEIVYVHDYFRGLDILRFTGK